MSYILDALQRADAERARGSVPGLHAKPVPATLPPSTPAARQRMALAIAAALALGAVATGLWVWRGPAESAAPSAPALMQTPAASGAMPPPVTASAMPIPLEPPPANVTRPLVAQASASATASASETVRKPMSVITPQVTPPAPPSPLATSQEKAKEVAVSAAAPAPLLGELPQDIRSQIPALTITGTVYSDNPQQRLLLVNGQVLAQGSTVAPELTVLEIRADYSEFSFRGTRFRVSR